MKEKLKKIGEALYELPKEGKMKVPGRLFVSKKLLDDVQEQAIEQVANVATLPGIVGFSFAQSDVHLGYGSSIGGVAVFSRKDGIISPGIVGFDINCGVRLLKTNLRKEDLVGKEKELGEDLFKQVPAGLGSSRKDLMLNQKELEKVLVQGIDWTLKKGYASKEDLKFVEANGKLSPADPKLISQKAKGRGLNQLGTLGSGNHFLEVQYVEKVFDQEVGNVFGLNEGQVVVMIHTGSRGLGHQVATDFLRNMERDQPELVKSLVDRQLIYAKFDSVPGRNYFSAMNAAANFAFVNRQVITHFVREGFKKVFPEVKIDLVYDLAHNIAKVEKYGGEDLIVHRKGATRAFGPGREDLPAKYFKTGHPVLVPGSMGTSSYVLVGLKGNESISFSSAPHGAGRVLSRSKASKTLDRVEVDKDLEQKGILVLSASSKGFLEEAPQAYKDVDEVVRVASENKIVKPVARMKPIIVVKG